MTSFYRQLFIYAGALFLALALIDSPRAAAVGGPGPGCSTHNDSLSRSGSIITGSASQSCDGVISTVLWRDVTVYVQRSRWWGWETMATSSSGWNTPAFYSKMYATYNCAGTGTHSFRALAVGSAFLDTFDPVFESLYEAQWSC